jgi:hypothetical protein
MLLSSVYVATFSLDSSVDRPMCLWGRFGNWHSGLPSLLHFCPQTRLQNCYKVHISWSSSRWATWLRYRPLHCYQRLLQTWRSSFKYWQSWFTGTLISTEAPEFSPACTRFEWSMLGVIRFEIIADIQLISFPDSPINPTGEQGC